MNELVGIMRRSTRTFTSGNAIKIRVVHPELRHWKALAQPTQ